MRETDAPMLFPDMPDWSVNTLRLMSEGTYGGSDAGEIYRTAFNMTGRTWRDWADGWTALAHSLVNRADAAMAAGAPITARDALLRASNYLRHGEFYVPFADPLKLDLYNQCQAAFHRAVPYMPSRVDIISIPYMGTTLDGYLCHPVQPSAEPQPAVIFLGGADSLAEELYFIGGRALAERGVYAILVDTPGRGSAIRSKGLVSRPDYEVPVRAIYDWASQQPGIDAGRVGLWGISLAGYYAPRAAAFMPEIKALSCWCGCFDVVDELYDFFPPLRAQMQWLSGAQDDADARRRLSAFNLADVAGRIKCPVQIFHAEGDDIIAVRGAQNLSNALQTEHELHLLPVEKGGRYHCHWDQASMVMPQMADWLVAKLRQ